MGKAKIIIDKLDKLKHPNKKVVLKKSDRIFDHEAKLEAGVTMLNDEYYKLSLSVFYEGTDYERIKDLVARESILADLERFFNRVRKGHELRLKSSFVYFDSETNEPKIGHAEKDPRFFLHVHTAISDRVKDLKKVLTLDKGYTLQ